VSEPAVQIRIKSGRDRRTLVCTDPVSLLLTTPRASWAYDLKPGTRKAAGTTVLRVGTEIPDSEGELWTITKITRTGVLARVPLPVPKEERA